MCKGGWNHGGRARYVRRMGEPGVDGWRTVKVLHRRTCRTAWVGSRRERAVAD